ncbi:chlorite dismutase [Arthrobacter sp. NamB2]|uniref:hydrogen peroxide-dependent heme synthase n=1 Tax=Arthrobacter sp. NamB2 TaxID=2576035 RepID=UPI0010C9DCC9|nr:hydrogen peroxide-dependent heme synthase [Arthrobacter sp. NamB2]TKV29657.1 chlorite dismutase [Arthrobacter sp. NamB2]
MTELTGSTPAHAPQQTGEGDDAPGELFYTLWTVFKRGTATTTSGARTLEEVLSSFEEDGVVLRGFYDVSALRADADVLVWLHGPRPEDLQAAVRRLRRTETFAETTMVWSAMGVHRDAEFSKSHSPAFSRGVAPAEWVCVYPFVRSYDWYILPTEERRGMLMDHGMKGRKYPQVISNTVSSFALNDYEWILALEAPELVDLVDLMRYLRETEARRHVREEVPFYTGRRINHDEIAEVLQ